jgi:hypothetical protein
MVQQVPGYYDRFDPVNKPWKKILFREGKPVQAAEFNEIQSMLGFEHEQLASTFYKDGAAIQGLSLITTPARDYPLHVASAQAYAVGDRVKSGLDVGYRCIQAHTSTGILLTNTAYWVPSGAKVEITSGKIYAQGFIHSVWGWAKRHPASRVIMVRGVGSDSAPLLARVKRERNRQGKLVKYVGRFYNFGTSVMKMFLYRNLPKQDPAERGYVGFPMGMPDEYFRQLTAERRTAVKRRDGFTNYKWVKDPNQANEMLDTMLQAEAAAIKLGLRDMPDKVWDRLESERGTPPAEAQLDLEDMMGPGRSPGIPKPAPPAAKAAGRRIRSKGI